MNKLTKSLAVFTLIAMLFTMFSVVGYAEPTSDALTTSTEECTSIPTDILGTTSYEYSQFKDLINKGVLDVELLKALNEGLNDMMASVAQGTLDTCSADFINLISDATVCFDKTDFNGLTVENNDNDDKDF